MDIPVKNAAIAMAVLIVLYAGTGADMVRADGIDSLRPEVASSMNPVGSGARAIGMGGAFIGVADDATAASWNPGGLVQLETPELSIVGTYTNRQEDLSFGTNPEASGNQGVEFTELNYLSLAYPFNLLDRNMIVSLNYQRLYDFTRDWAFSMVIEEDSSTDQVKVNVDNEGDLSALGLAYSVQVTPKFSFGLTFNLWEDLFDDNGWKNESTLRGSGTGIGTATDTYSYEYYLSDTYAFSGFNFNVGLLWQPTSRLTLGAVLKTPFTASLRHNRSIRETFEYSSSPEDNLSETESNSSDESLDMPMSYGFGVAFRLSDRITTSLDIHRTEWDQFIIEDAQGNRMSPINGKPVSEANISPTITVRGGAEYLYIANTYVVPIRIGCFYDQAPAEGSPDDLYGFSTGTGIVKGRIAFDLAYQYRFGNDVSQYMLDELDFSMDVREHKLYASIIVYL